MPAKRENEKVWIWVLILAVVGAAISLGCGFLNLELWEKVVIFISFAGFFGVFFVSIYKLIVRE